MTYIYIYIYIYKPYSNLHFFLYVKIDEYIKQKAVSLSDKNPNLKDIQSPLESKQKTTTTTTTTQKNNPEWGRFSEDWEAARELRRQKIVNIILYYTILNTQNISITNNINSMYPLRT